VADDAPQLSDPVLVVVLDGFVDAGNAARLAAEALLEGRETTPVVHFDVDQLVDYRSRRPPLQFETDHWASYTPPVLDIVAVTDTGDTPYLLLFGPEPDSQWERFVAAIEQIVRRFGVRLVITLSGIPMAVPHTRPIGVTAHATRADLVEGHTAWFGSAEVPGSARTLLDHTGVSAGLFLPTETLTKAAERTEVEIAEQVENSEEVAQVVAALERQYDTVAEAAGEGGSGGLGGELPSAEELAAEVERFLAMRDPEDELPGDDD